MLVIDAVFVNLTTYPPPYSTSHASTIVARQISIEHVRNVSHRLRVLFCVIHCAAHSRFSRFSNLYLNYHGPQLECCITTSVTAQDKLKLQRQPGKGEVGRICSKQAREMAFLNYRWFQISCNSN